MLVRDLWHLRGQVLAAALVVACGVTALVAMRGTYDSLHQARDDYYARYRFAQVFAHLKRAPDALAARIAALPGVAAVTTRVVADVTLDVPGLAEPASARLVSIPDQGAPALNDLALVRGRAPQSGRDDEVLASETFARANGLQPGERIGAILQGRWKSLTLVGTALSPEYVYEVGPGMLFPDNRRFGVLWMRHEALAAAFDLRGAFNDVALALHADAVPDDAIAALDRLLAPYGGLSAYGADEQLSNRFLTDEFAEIRIMATWIPGIFLGTAVFLLYIVLSRLVTMQRAEIGLLKAFGYSDVTVGLHYLKLAVATVTIGAAIGLAGGFALGRAMVGLYGVYFHFPDLRPVLGLDIALLATGVALAAAVAGAAAAVRLALRQPPAEAMRPEAPASFRHGWLERVDAARRLPASVRAILRNLARRKWKSALAIAAIAVAVATMVVGRFAVDASRYLMAVQFGQVQRDDVTVLLDAPVPIAVLDDARRLPGVLRAEAFRSAPVRLRVGHRSKRVELLGLAPDTELRRLVDVDLRAIPLPRDGLALSTRLAQRLGVVPGEPVEVSFLDGRRRQVTMTLAARVDELLGLNAYVDAGLLATLLGETPSATGLWLSVDPQQAAALYARLKRMPRVGGVAVSEAMRASIQDTLDRSFVVMTTILVLLAGLLVGGVVYNSARIALSERGNELASLRVLGFTQAEIARLLLGEQALLVIVAALPGLALGYGLCAALVPAFDRDVLRLPLVVAPITYLFALATLAAAAVVSGLLVARRLRSLDLIAVLKTRE
jgi:putative ABC transport system permease protein